MANQKKETKYKCTMPHTSEPKGKPMVTFEAGAEYSAKEMKLSDKPGCFEAVEKNVEEVKASDN